MSTLRQRQQKYVGSGASVTRTTRSKTSSSSPPPTTQQSNLINVPSGSGKTIITDKATGDTTTYEGGRVVSVTKGTGPVQSAYDIKQATRVSSAASSLRATGTIPGHYSKEVVAAAAKTLGIEKAVGAEKKLEGVKTPDKDPGVTYYPEYAKKGVSEQPPVKELGFFSTMTAAGGALFQKFSSTVSGKKIDKQEPGGQTTYSHTPLIKSRFHTAKEKVKDYLSLSAYEKAVFKQEEDAKIRAMGIDLFSSEIMTKKVEGALERVPSFRKSTEKDIQVTGGFITGGVKTFLHFGGAIRDAGEKAWLMSRGTITEGIGVRKVAYGATVQPVKDMPGAFKEMGKTAIDIRDPETGKIDYRKVGERSAEVSLLFLGLRGARAPSFGKQVTTTPGKPPTITTQTSITVGGKTKKITSQAEGTFTVRDWGGLGKPVEVKVTGTGKGRSAIRDAGESKIIGTRMAWRTEATTGKTTYKGGAVAESVTKTQPKTGSQTIKFTEQSMGMDWLATTPSKVKVSQQVSGSKGRIMEGGTITTPIKFTTPEGITITRPGGRTSTVYGMDYAFVGKTTKTRTASPQGLRNVLKKTEDFYALRRKAKPDIIGKGQAEIMVWETPKMSFDYTTLIEQPLRVRVGKDGHVIREGISYPTPQVKTAIKAESKGSYDLRSASQIPKGYKDVFGTEPPMPSTRQFWTMEQQQRIALWKIAEAQKAGPKGVSGKAPPKTPSKAQAESLARIIEQQKKGPIEGAPSIRPKPDMFKPDPKRSGQEPFFEQPTGKMPSQKQVFEGPGTSQSLGKKPVPDHLYGRVGKELSGPRIEGMLRSQAKKVPLAPGKSAFRPVWGGMVAAGWRPGIVQDSWSGVTPIPRRDVKPVIDTAKDKKTTPVPYTSVISRSIYDQSTPPPPAPVYFTPPPPPPPPRPWKPGIPLPFDGKLGAPPGKQQAKHWGAHGRYSKYTPSLTSMIFGIKTRKKQADFTTGFDIRPLVGR